MLKTVLLIGAVAAFAVPGTAAARNGVVVKVDRPAALTAVAGAHGSVVLVHAKANVKLGQKVTFQAHSRTNGTLASTGFRVVGVASRVHVRGVVLAHRSTGYAISARGAVLPIHVLRRTSSATDTGLPPVGTTVDVTATIADDELDEEHAQPVLADARSGAIEGHLVTGPAGTIAVRSSGLTLVIAVPAGFDTSKFTRGDEVLASFQRQPDGSLVLTALASNDEQDDEGDDGGDDDHGGDHHGGRGD